MKIKSVSIGEVKAGPEDGLNEGEFLVYPSTFTRRPDSYGDVVAKGAFIRTIKEWEDSGNVLPGLYGHRMDDPDYFVAGALEMSEDEHGWRVKGEFDLESPKGRQVYRLVKGRRLNQLSFAYDVREEARIELEDGQKANELRDVKVYEFSFVPIGANQDTSVVAVKALADVIKEGIPLSPKSETALREARDAIDSVLTSFSEEDGKAAPAADQHDQEKASGESSAEPSATDVDTSPAPGEDEKSAPPVERLAAEIQLRSLKGEKEV